MSSDSQRLFLLVQDIAEMRQTLNAILAELREQNGKVVTKRTKCTGGDTTP